MATVVTVTESESPASNLSLEPEPEPATEPEPQTPPESQPPPGAMTVTPEFISQQAEMIAELRLAREALNSVQTDLSEIRNRVETLEMAETEEIEVDEMEEIPVVVDEPENPDGTPQTATVQDEPAAAAPAPAPKSVLRRVLFGK